eukprot:4963038-Alexandrium_andersonii.AAC.1
MVRRIVRTIRRCVNQLFPASVGMHIRHRGLAAVRGTEIAACGGGIEVGNLVAIRVVIQIPNQSPADCVPAPSADLLTRNTLLVAAIWPWVAIVIHLGEDAVIEAVEVMHNGLPQHIFGVR